MSIVNQTRKIKVKSIALLPDDEGKISSIQLIYSLDDFTQTVYVPVTEDTDLTGYVTIYTPKQG